MARFSNQVRRASAAAVLIALSASRLAFAQTPGPIGVWENKRTGMVLEFSPKGEVKMSGAATSHFRVCDAEGGNICIAGEGFECHYRADLDAKTKTLRLFTGRPTKDCPDGVFRAKPR